MADIREVNPLRYGNPELFRHAGSMEGIPEWVDPVQPQGFGLWRHTAREWFGYAAVVLPGIVIAGLLALAGRELSDLIGIELLGFETSPLSPILVAILLGLLIRNAIGLPEAYQPGLRLCLQRVLRFGVALLGLRVSLALLGTIGSAALPIVLATITTALVGVTLINRVLGLPSRLGALIAVGTAICGNSAIVATAPVIGARENEVSYAVGCVTLFGLVALVGYPFVANELFAADARAAGLFLGSAIHDTAQVAGAALLYFQQFDAPDTLDAALVTKLLRNTFMVAVIPAMAMIHRSEEAEPGRKTPSFLQAVPIFVLGFLACAVLRSIGDSGDAPFGGALSSEAWQRIIEIGTAASTWCLTLAMAAVGLGTDLGHLRTLGVRPLLVGLAAALTVGVVSAGLIRATALG